MGVTQYIGARYVPIFADPAEWNDTRTYEPLTIVLYQGNSFTSRQFVPTGIDINNTEYWMSTGVYNAQVEAYRQEVRQFDRRITANAEGIEALNDDLETFEGTTNAAIDTLNTDYGAFKEATNRAIENLDEEIANSKNLEGFALANYEVFSDNSAWASGDTANVWDYFRDIFNEPETRFNVNRAPVNTGWIKTNTAGQNARTYLISIAQEQTEEYRKSVQYVILNFGFYDIVNNQSGDYETEGRNVVNVASNWYPNALIVVNPVSNNYCYGYNRNAQLNFYILNYGMVRSQVPIKIVPWYISFNVNQLAPSHYYDTNSDNPSLLNAGGTNSVAAMIKATLFGCENGYERMTRSNLGNFLNSSWFTASNAEFELDVETMTVSLSSGKITAQQDITESNQIVGRMTAPTFTVNDDIILALCIQNTQNKTPRITMTREVSDCLGPSRKPSGLRGYEIFLNAGSYAPVGSKRKITPLLTVRSAPLKRK